MPNHYVPEDPRWFNPIPHLTFGDDVRGDGGFIFFLHGTNVTGCGDLSVVIDTYKNAYFLAHVVAGDDQPRVYESVALLVKDLQEECLSRTPDHISITAAAFELHKTVQTRANTGDQIALCMDCGGDDGCELISGPFATHTAFVKWASSTRKFAHEYRYCATCAAEYNENVLDSTPATPTGRPFITHDEIDAFWRERL